MGNGRKRNSTVDLCSCCGQIIPPKLHFLNSVQTTVPAFRAAPVKQRIYDYIAAHSEGISRDRIFNAVYGSDPNGGPDTLGVISVHVRNINKYLEENGAPLRIRSTRGLGALYKLVAV